MRGYDSFHVVDFAIGSGAAIVWFAVPTGDALFGGSD